MSCANKANNILFFTLMLNIICAKRAFLVKNVRQKHQAEHLGGSIFRLIISKKKVLLLELKRAVKNAKHSVDGC